MSDNETLRDTFAAAAMTGIIAASDDSEIKQPQAEFLARQAWLVADAMLRERAATNHDAVPAAKAAELARSPGQSPRGTGDTTREPVAWAAIDGYGRVVFTAPSAAACGGVEPLTPWRIVPLYRHALCQDFSQKNLTPALTDAEREAVAWAATEAESWSTEDDDTPDIDAHAVTLRDLLARLGGGT